MKNMKLSELQQLKFFAGDEHQPFNWPGGQPAALLVHGFPGSPADMRALGESLHEAGWTVHGLLLPGLGPELASIINYTCADWLAAADAALAELQQTHRPVLLIGHSMGAGLSIKIATSRWPDGLVLLAPFWQLGTWWQRWLALAVKPFFPYVQPFKYINFSEPMIRREILDVMPNLNLDDPAVQQQIRRLPVPIKIFEQLMALGRAVRQSAGRAAAPTLVIQGTLDDTVKVTSTRYLLQKLAGPLRYVEVSTGHHLVRGEDPGWPVVEQEVLTFARALIKITE